MPPGWQGWLRLGLHFFDSLPAASHHCARSSHPLPACLPACLQGEAEGLEPSEAVFEGLVGHLCDQGDLEGARSMLQQMKVGLRVGAGAVGREGGRPAWLSCSGQSASSKCLQRLACTA